MSCLFAIAVIISHFRSSVSSVPLTLPDGSPNYAGLCAHRDFCTTKAIKNITDPTESSCCQKCSCLPDCYDVGTCCPDMPKTDLRQPKYACKDLSYFSRQIPNINPGRLGISFRVVDDCPNKTMSSKYPGCENTTKLNDYIFVSDMMNERIYRNDKCAQCNGISKFMRWKIQVSECKDLFTTMFTTIEQRDQYLMANCIVTSLQPAPGIGTMSRCIDKTAYDVPDYCRYSTMNETISRLCEENIPSTSTIYLTQGAYRSLEYPNIFCYFCEVGGINIDGVCPKFKFVIPSRMSMNQFSAILHGEEPASKNADRDSGGHGCKHSTLWDPFAKQCRQFYCPIGTIPAGSRCKPALQLVTGLVFTLHFIIETEEWYSSLDRNISSIVDTTLQNDMRENGIQCDMCDRGYFRHKTNNDSGLFVEFSIISSEICSPKGLLKWARHLLSQGTMHFPVKGEQQPFVIRLRLSAVPAIKEENRKYMFWRSGNICANFIPLIDWMYLNCRFFRLNADSLSHVGSRRLEQTEQNVTLAIQYHNSSDVAICVNHYFSIQSSVAVVTSARTNFTSLFLLSFFLFLIYNAL